MRSDHLSKHMKRHQNPSQKRSTLKNSTNYKTKNKNPVSPSSSSSLEEQCLSQYSTKTFNSESSDCF
jgi:hypothetical protein